MTLSAITKTMQRSTPFSTSMSLIIYLNNINEHNIIIDHKFSLKSNKY